MTYTQMKMLIEFIKLVVECNSRGGFGVPVPLRAAGERDRMEDLEKRLLVSCGYERKF